MNQELRDKLVEIAKLWPGNDGCDWPNVSNDDIILLIKDSVLFDRKMIIQCSRILSGQTVQ
jgi:hypothetical protein